MASFGELILCLSGFFSAAGGAVCLAKGNERRFFSVTHNLLVAAAACSSLAIVSLLFLLITHDFRVEYVRDYVDRTMSTGFVLTAVWGGQAGSLLFWAFLQTLFTAAAAVWYKNNKDLSLAPISFGFLATLQVFFIFLVLFESNPFELLGSAATKGIGLNPLLRNPYMVFHPPTLFLGFAGFSVPMAFALGALAENKLDTNWLLNQRLWILFAWVFLSIGNILGMVWAYEELGWGGYWGWDPVENASLMPWFTATALLHSAMAEKHIGQLRRFNIVLIAVTFLLVIFGTFLTRSNIIESVHAFSGATSGPYFLGLIITVGSITLFLLGLRFKKLKPKTTNDAVLTKGFWFGINNYIFVVATVFVGVATLMPLFTQLFIGEKATSTPAFFNRWMIPLGLILLLVLGICSRLRWKNTDEKGMLKKLIFPIVVGTAVVSAIFIFGGRIQTTELLSIAPFVAIGLLFFTGLNVLATLRQTLIARHKPNNRNSSNKRLGGQLVHLAMVLMFIGFTGSGFTTEDKGSLGRGEYLEIADYKVTFLGLRGDRDFEREAMFADLEIKSPNGQISLQSPAKYFYHSHPNQPTSEVVIKTGLFEDLFLILGETDTRRGRAVIRVVVNPLVIWIWIGGILLVLGTLVAMTPVGGFIKLVSFQPQIKSFVKSTTGAMLLFGITTGIIGLFWNLPMALAFLGAGLLFSLIWLLWTSVSLAFSTDTLTPTPVDTTETNRTSTDSKATDKPTDNSNPNNSNPKKDDPPAQKEDA